MSNSGRLEGERVFCHQCNNEWDRANGGLTCPRCEGEFTEILSPDEQTERETDSAPPTDGFHTHNDEIDIPRHPLAHHNPWADAPDPEEGDISTYEFSTPFGGGRGMFSYSASTRLYNPRRSRMEQMPGFPFGPLGFGGQQGFGGPQARVFGAEIQGGGDLRRNPHGPAGPQPGDMQDLFGMIFQTMNQGAFAQPRRPGEARAAPNNPFELLGTLLGPMATGRAGDTVWSQEAFDRILEQLAEQNGQSTAPGPAAESAIKSLPTKKVEKEMLGNDGTAECSICMDNVEIGSDVTVLPCEHWFHGDCVIAWLKEHDTCPHCRKPITKPEDQPEPGRRSSRRSSSVASPYRADGSRENPFSIPDSPSAMRDQRQFYYGSRRDPEERPDGPRRHSSGRPDRPDRRGSNRSNSGGNSGGGVTGWFRNRMGFGDG